MPHALKPPRHRSVGYSNFADRGDNMRSSTSLFLTVLCMSLAVLGTSVCGFCDGVIIPDNPQSAWLTIVYHHVQVQIRGGLVTTNVDQVFRNDSPREVEGRYVFPLSQGASVSAFSMWVDGVALEAKILEADEARTLYEDYVRRAIDPALLEYVGRDTLSARVFPVPAGGERRIQLSYTELIPAENGVYLYRYPLDTERLSAAPLEGLTISVDLATETPLRALYSPTHGLAVNRISDKSATAFHQDSDILPATDFVFYYSVYPDQMGMTLLTYRTSGEDGYFLLILTPPAVSHSQDTIPKDLVFVLDKSGSMSGSKIEQAKQALEFVLENLNQGDRFALVTFSDSAEGLQPELTPVSTESIDNALQRVRGLEASGGTNIDEALKVGFSLLDQAGRPKFLVFLTDGEATVGEMDPLTIIGRARDANVETARLFTFGVGYDVNTLLLDRLAQENRGTTTYVQPGESLEVVLSNFYEKIDSPVLADLKLNVDGPCIYNSYPRVLPDLFRGNQLILVGRYRGDSLADIGLSGEARGESLNLSCQRSFHEVSLDASFLPRLWAGRKIASLLEQIRLYGETDELVDDVIRLSRLFGIITPYTSFLVDESSVYSAEEMADAVRTAAAPTTGSQAVSGAAALKILAEAGTVPSSGEMVRTVEDRTYWMKNGMWTDSTYDGTETIDIAVFSQAYFDLLEILPWIGPHLALGEALIVQIGGDYLQIGSSGIEQLDDNLRDLLRE